MANVEVADRDAENSMRRDIGQRFGTNGHSFSLLRETKGNEENLRPSTNCKSFVLCNIDLLELSKAAATPC